MAWGDCRLFQNGVLGSAKWWSQYGLMVWTADMIPDTTVRATIELLVLGTILVCFAPKLILNMAGSQLSSQYTIVAH